MGTVRSLLREYEHLVPSLAAEKRPVFLYGMGDGAEKIMKYLSERGIKIKGVVASDGFVRGQSFAGYKVISVSEAEKTHGALCLVLCFGLEDDRHLVLDPLTARGDRVVSPNLPVFGGGCCDADYISEREEDFEKLRAELADGLSVSVFDSLLKYNITGDPAQLELAGADAIPEGFYSRGGIHIDVGAYDGDTVAEYLACAKDRRGRVIAFEPDRKTFKKLLENTKDIKNITAVNALVGSKNGAVPFVSGSGRASHAAPCGETVDCVTVDSYCGFGNISSDAPRVTSIKIDAEGMDEDVICGAANTVYCCKTNVCVALYHRCGDLIAIPRLLRSCDYKYRFFLRKKQCLPAWDVFLYAMRTDL